MSIKSKVFAAAATLTLVGGVSAVGTLSASAATPSCGPGCFNFFSKDFNTGATPSFVVDVFRQGERVGQPIIQFRASNSDPAEDFTSSLQGQVADFLAAGLVSPVVALHYNFDPAFELEYAPFGVDSGLCVGVFATASQNEGVTLQPCGVSAKTVWIQDVGATKASVFTGLVGGFHPLINGSDTNFSHPFVLTYPSNGFPTDIPRPQLKVANLTGFSNSLTGGAIINTVSSNQLWSWVLGVLP